MACRKARRKGWLRLNKQDSIVFFRKHHLDEGVNQNPILIEAKILGKLHAINAKKIDSSNLKVAKNSVARGHDEVYRYSIADFIQDVNKIFDDTFSLDVHKHVKTKRRSNDFS